MGIVMRPTKIDAVPIGRRIAALRKKAGLTQAQLAKRLGIAPPSVAAYEIGKTCPALEHLISLARIFGTTTDALLGVVPLRMSDGDLTALTYWQQLSPDRRKLAIKFLATMAE